MKYLIKILLILSIFQTFSYCVFAKSIPGNRPDRAPSGIFSFLSSSIENRIIGQAKIVKEKKDDYRKKPEKGGFLFNRSPKKKAREKLDIEKDELKDLLASTPTGVEKQDIGKQDVDRSNKEAVEVKFSTENLRNTVKEFHEQFKNDPVNLELATRYYESHIICLENIVEMHHTFVENVENKYKPSIRKIIKQAVNQMAKNYNALQVENFSDENQLKVKKLIKNLEIVSNKLKEALVTVEKQKEWAINRIPNLQKELKLANLANETLVVTKEAEAIIQNIMSDYDKLKLTPPPLIVFDVDLSRFELEE